MAADVVSVADKSDVPELSAEPASLEERIVFRSKDLLVRAVARRADAVCYVTFDSYTDLPGLDREGFGEAHFRSRGISAIHVISRDNRWYQHPELPEALAAVARETVGCARVVAYGSSMGGFAALMYGSACGAHVGLALSPQYSLKPKSPPYDGRWAADVAHIRFQPFAPAPLSMQHIVFDPRDRLDRAHATLFAARSPTVLVGIPNAGHPVGSYVNETEMFELLFTGVVEGTLTLDTAPALERELRRRRRMSGQYFYSLAVRNWQRHLARSISLAKEAVAVRPDSATYHSFLGFLLDRVQAYDEAAAAHACAVNIPGINLHARVNHALHHADRGNLDHATELAATLYDEFPRSLAVRICMSRIRRRRRRVAIARYLVARGLGPLLDIASRGRWRRFLESYAGYRVAS